MLVTFLGAGREAYCTIIVAGKEVYCTKTGAGKEAYCTILGGKRIFMDTSPYGCPPRWGRDHWVRGQADRFGLKWRGNTKSLNKTKALSNKLWMSGESYLKV